MVDALLETKLLRPRLRRDAVPRTRLAGLLTRAVEAPVTLVSAPAGFGKTTLVETWLRSGDRVLVKGSHVVRMSLVVDALVAFSRVS